MRTVICIAGFGDNSSMFDSLATTPISSTVRLRPINLPGFGAPPLTGGPTTLQRLAQSVNKAATNLNADTVLAHSVASIVAALAASDARSPITTILSLEGNLTADDAYFSGTAADYDDAATFNATFLKRLDDMAAGDPVMSRYRSVVATANPQALWELGCDARRYSNAQVPGEVLKSAAKSAYLYSRENVPPASLAWLATSQLPAFEMPGASHWASVDRPELLSETMTEALEIWD